MVHGRVAGGGFAGEDAGGFGKVMSCRIRMVRRFCYGGGNFERGWLLAATVYVDIFRLCHVLWGCRLDDGNCTVGLPRHRWSSSLDSLCCP